MHSVGLLYVHGALRTAQATAQVKKMYDLFHMLKHRRISDFVVLVVKLTLV